MMKIATISFASLLVTSGFSMAKDWKEVHIATEGAYPPFNYTEPSGELAGFDVDYAKALCEKMKVKCTIGAQDWDGIIPALLAGKYDAIVASMSVTEERKKKVAFTSVYYQSPATILAPKDTTIEDVTVDSMKGVMLGAQASSIQANYAEEAYVPAGANLKLYSTLDEMYLDLASRRLDAVIADKIVSSEWMKKEGKDCCKFVGDIDLKANINIFGEGAGIAVRKEDEDLKAMFNKAIAESIADGTHDKITSKYFNFKILNQ